MTYYRIDLDAEGFGEFPSELLGGFDGSPRELDKYLEETTPIYVERAKEAAKKQGREGRHWLVVNDTTPVPNNCVAYITGHNLYQLPIWVE